MRDDSTTQGVLFEELFDQPLLARFDQPDSSSDGGAVLLKACDQKLKLIDAIAACLREQRNEDEHDHHF